MSATTQAPTRKIDVYLDSPVWAKHARWFNVPSADLDALWVAEYTITAGSDNWIDEADVENHADEVRKLHPGCILVY